MSHSHKQRRRSAAFLTQFLLAGALALLMPLRAQAAPAPDDIVFVSVKGDVQLTSAGKTQEPHAGSILELPAALQTGKDGSADLRQAETTIAVGPDTRLDFPAAAERGDPIDRVSQPAGNAYYRVGPRGGKRMRVETPYLVAVIKGTQFNVAVTADTSTISLHEGRLEILATEEGIAAIELNAGEVAVRKRGERAIRVLQVKNGSAASAVPTRIGDRDGDEGEVTANLPSGNGDGGVDGLVDDLPPANGPGDVFAPGIPDSPEGLANGGLDVGIDSAVDVAGDAQIGADIGLGLGSVGADAGVDLGVDLGSGTVEAGVDAGVDLGTVSAEATADVGVDLGSGTVDAGVDAAVDLGAASADADVATSVDLGSGSVDAGVDAAVDLGAVGSGADLGVGADVAADAGAGTIDAGVDADVAGAETSVDVGIDLTGGDAGVDVGVSALGTEIDLGIGGDAPAGDGGEAETSQPVGLLGGILGRQRN